MQILIIIFMMTFSATVWAEDKEGWYWYKEPPQEEQPQDTPNPQTESKPPHIPSLKDYTYDQIWNMHPDQFQPLLKDFRKKAVQNPSIENVKEYYVMQDIARRKAKAFTNVAMLMMQQSPKLSLEKDYPITAPGRRARVAQMSHEITQTLQKYRDQFAVLYFTSKTCAYCKAQDPIVSSLNRKTGISIQKIDIDLEPSLAHQFDVQITPQLILIHKHDSEFMTLSSGVISSSDLEKRVYRSMRHLLGKNTPEQHFLYDFQRQGAFDASKDAGKEAYMKRLMETSNN